MTDMDDECIGLCVAMNKLPGIETVESCCGHKQRPFHIWFKFDQKSRGLVALTYLIDSHRNKYVFDWKLEVVYNDNIDDVMYVLIGYIGVYSEANILAREIESLIDGTWPNYNPLVKE